MTITVGHICSYIDYFLKQGKTYEQLCDELSDDEKKYILMRMRVDDQYPGIDVLSELRKYVTLEMLTQKWIDSMSDDELVDFLNTIPGDNQEVVNVKGVIMESDWYDSVQNFMDVSEGPNRADDYEMLNSIPTTDRDKLHACMKQIDEKLESSSKHR